MKIVHLSLVTRGMYLTNTRETLTLWLTKNPDISPDDPKYFTAGGYRDIEAFSQDWERCEKQLVPIVDMSEDDKLEEIRLDDRGFPIFTFRNDIPVTKPIVFENYNSDNSGITDMYLLVEDSVCKWAVLNNLSECVECESFGDTAGTGKIENDPFVNE